MSKKTTENENIDSVLIIKKGECRIGPYKDKGKHFRKLIIEGDVERVRREAFMGCRTMTSLEIRDGVKEIEEFAFSSCRNLTSVIIPDSVSKICKIFYRHLATTKFIGLLF